MRPNTAVKYSLFLIFLALGHEFTSAYRVREVPSSRDRWSEDSFKQPEFQKPKFSDSVPRYDEDFKDFKNKRSDNYTDVAEVVSPQKRWVAAVALGVSVGVSLAGIGFEVYLKLEGCCGLYPEICNVYIKEFKAVQKRLKPLFDKVDFAALTAKNTLEDITQTNYRLIEIWNDMKRIRDLKVKLLYKLSASTIKSFNTKWAEIESQLQKANDTVRKFTYAQLSAEFGSYLDNYEKALLGFTPLFAGFLGLAAIPAFNAYKQRSLNQQINRLSTGQNYRQLVTARHGKAAKILGVQNLNAHIQQTATARNNARFATSTYTKYIVGGISIVGTLIGVGVEIYAAFQKIVHCRDTVRDNAKKGRDDVVKGEKLLKGVYKNVTDYISMIDKKGVQYLKDQLSSERVLVELEAIRKLAKNAGKKAQSKNMTIAADALDAYIVGIRDANAKKTYQLSADLANGLARVKFLYTCYDAKVSLVNFCVDNCKTGSNSLDIIYANGTKHFDVKAKECLDDVGVPYYSLADMKFTMKKEAAKGGFSDDCILNSKAERDKICRMYNEDRLTKEQIKGKEGLTIAQIDYYLARCPKKDLTPAQMDNICFLRSFGATNEQIHARGVLPRYVTLAQVKAVKCPRPTAKP